MDSQVVLGVKNPTCNTRDQGSVPGSGRSPGEGLATHFSTLAWRIPWTEEPGGLQSTGSQWVGHDWATNTHIANVAFLPTLSCLKARTMSWFKASCQLLPLCLEIEIGAQEITGGSHLELESWDSLCNDVWKSFHILLFLVYYGWFEPIWSLIFYVPGSVDCVILSDL